VTSLGPKRRSTTVFRYKGQVLDPQKVGRDLNVRTVLTGRVVQQKDALIIELS
jgi:TolB-like protein